MGGNSIKRATLKRFYRDSSSYHQHLEVKDKQYFEPHLRFVADHVAAGAVILDLGCGTGVSTRGLNHLGYRVVGCDLRITGRANRDGSERFCEADGMQLPFRDRSFDAVVCYNYLEHVPNPEWTLTEMLRVCAVNGRILIDGSNLLSPVHPLKILMVHFLRTASAHEHKRRLLTPFGNSPTAIIRCAARNALWLLGKMITGKCAFINREPDLSHPEIGGDLDAIWWSNPTDLKHWFRQQDHRILAYQTEGRTRFLRDFAAGLKVVVERLH